MRNWALAAVMLVLLAQSAQMVLSQELSGPVRPQFTPLAIEEPRRLVGGYQESPGLVREVRQIAAEAALEPATGRPPLKLAPKSEAGRQSLQKPAAVSPGRALGTVAGSLGVVLGLFLVVAWCLQRVGPKHSTRLPKEAVEIVGQAPLAGRQQMQLVRVGNRLLLLALNAGSVETLAEIHEPAEVEHLLALCQRNLPSSASAAFRQALEELATGREDPPRTRVATGMRGGR